MKSKENFEIKFTIKDKNGRIIELKKNESWEIDWGKKQQTPKEVVFEKDDKVFKIIIEELELWSGLLKKKVKGWFPELPPNASYQIYHGESGSDPREITDRGEDFEYVRIANPWRKDLIVIASVLLLVIIIVIIVYCWYQNKKSKFK